MLEYKYKALTTDGRRAEGICRANSEAEVLGMVRERNWYPIEIYIGSDSKVLKLEFFNKVKGKDISIFCRQFATMLNAGLTIVNILEVIGKQTNHKKLKSAIEEVHEDVQKGFSFSDSMKQRGDVFPGLLTSMVEAGEVSGNLDIIMDRMAIHYEKEYKINNKIKSAMMYPIILGVVAFGVAIFLLLFVLPNFEYLFTSVGVELPLLTKALLKMSQNLQRYYFIVFPAVFSFLLMLIRYFKTPSGRWIMDRVKLNTPIVKGPVKDIVTSRFTRTFSLLFSSGVPLIKSLELTASVIQNVVVEQRILELKEHVRKGYTLSRAINDVDEFPPMMRSMIGVGEESGTLDNILDKTASFYDEEVDVAIQRLTTLIEPVMIVVMAVIVGFIVISIAMPMFEIIEVVQSTA